MATRRRSPTSASCRSSPMRGASISISRRIRRCSRIEAACVGAAGVREPRRRARAAGRRISLESDAMTDMPRVSLGSPHGADRRRRRSAFRSATSIASAATTPSTRRRWAAMRARSRRSSSPSRRTPWCRSFRPPSVASRYPLATKNFHHEIELVVAIGGSGVKLAPEDALRDCLGLRGRPRHDAPRSAERHAREEAAVGHRQVVRAGGADRSDPSGAAPSDSSRAARSGSTSTARAGSRAISPT